jgi:transposase
MPSIVGKRRGNQTYYYLVESARVDGKPRIVSQRYLGTAEEVLAKLNGEPGGRPVRSQYKRFGDVAAVWSVLDDLDVVGLVDDVVPRYANAGASVGTYLALAALNRVVDPRSKRAFADWWATTSGPRWVKLDQPALDHRRFWDAMDRLDESDLRAIETAVYGGMIDRYGLDLASMALDMTNFATYIDSTNDRAPIAQRGKAKQKRVDLRLVALALVVTRDGGIPIISHAYPGDRPDVTQFSTVLDDLVARYRLLVNGVQSLTVVYDAGQNSAANHERVEAAGIGFVGSLPPSDHPDLLAIPRRRYQLVDPDRFGQLTAVDTTVTALGVTRRAVLTHSPTLHAGQSRGLDQTLTKARAKLAELQARLHRGNTRRGRDKVEADLAAIVKPRWVNQLITATLTGETPATFRLSWRTNHHARTRLENHLFGKRILFTNRDHWSVADVVAGYRSQSDAEFGFRQLKDPHVVSFSPMHHWTDSKIRVHVFTCVLALATAHLMRRQAAHAGLPMSVRELLEHLEGIGETVLLHHDGGKGRPRAQRLLTDMTDTQRRLFDLYRLHRYAPTR